MKKALHSPWFTVCIAITALTVGYVVYLQNNGGIAAASYECPADGSHVEETL